MEKNIDIRMVENNRANANKFGNIFGSAVFTPSKEMCITDYNKRKQEMTDHDIFVTRNIERYKINAINVVGVNYGHDLEGETNITVTGIDAAGKEVDIPCSLRDPNFISKPTPDNIRKDITSNEGPKGFYTNVREVVKQLNSLNDKNIIRLENLKRDIEAWIEMLKTSNTDNIRKQDDFYNSLDGKSESGSVRVHMTIED